MSQERRSASISPQPAVLIRRGLPQHPFRDLYHFLLTLSWPGFLGLIACGYVASNAFFALAYLLEDNNIHNARPGSFADAFFFSVQTMATIGYGAMYPTTQFANLLVTVEALVGLLGVAVATGLTFARIARPTARVLFSQVAVINTLDGVPTLMFRVANQRQNQIVEAQIRVTFAQNQITREGEFMRRLYDLQLVRSMTPIFTVSWTVLHPITSNSPFFTATPASLNQQDVQLFVTLIGLDDTFSQTIHARHIYRADQIHWNHRFQDILHKGERGQRYVDYTHFHSTIPDPAPAVAISAPRD